MQIYTDMTGKFEDVQDNIQGNFVNIQRTINDLQNQLNAANTTIAALTAKLAAGATTIAPDGQVVGLPNAKGLQTVAHDFSMNGLGTPAKPLGVNMSYINSQISGSPILVSDATYTSTQIINSAATPLTILAGTSNFVTVPLFVNLSYVKNNVSWTNGGTTLNVRWVGHTAAALGTALVLNNTRASFCWGFSGANAAYNLDSIGQGFSALGLGLEITTAAALANPGGATFGPMRIRVLYTLVSQ